MDLVLSKGIRAAAAAAVLCSWLGMTSAASAESSSDAVRSSLATMNEWVGDGDNGKGWRAYLLSDQLDAQLAKGDQADAAVVQKVVEKYNSGAGGLDRPKFVTVRDALVAWIDDLDLPASGDLPTVARDAKGQYKPVSDEALANAKQQLSAATKQLDDYLTPGGANGTAWKSYLKWDQLEAALKSEEAPDLKRVRSVQGVYLKFRANQTGLELAVFTNVASALQHYRDLAVIKQNDKAGEQFASQLDSLATHLDNYTQAPAEPDAFAIGRRLGRLESSGQTGTLVRAVRHHHSRPNLWAQVSQRFLDAGIGRKVDDTSPVTENIMGTRISGKGHTVANMTVATVPNDEHARLRTLLSGRTQTETSGRNGPVTIFTNGDTRFEAVKWITVDDEGLHVTQAVCEADMDSEIQGISTSRDGRMGERMIRKVAWKRIGSQRGQAEAIGEQRAEKRVEKRFDDEADPEVAKANKTFNEDYRNPLLRLGEFPQLLRFSSSDDHLFVKALQANRYQLGAPDAPPEVDAEHDVSVRVHESLVNNFAAAIIAGKTYDDGDMEEMGKRLGGEWEEKMKSSDDDDPWSITYAQLRPVTVLFDNNQFSVTIRGRRFTSGDRAFKAMNISAVYKLEKTPTGAKLVRQGELKIFPPRFVEGETRLSASQVALRRLLTKRMGKMFPPEIVADSKELPGEWAKVGKLQLDQMVTSKGWLSLGWSAPQISQLARQATQTASK